MAGQGAVSDLDDARGGERVAAERARGELTTLEHVARRRVRLWVLSTVVLVTCVLGAAFLVLGGDLLPEALRGEDSISYIAAGLILALGVAFVFYTVEKEGALRGVTDALLAERDRSANLSHLDELRRDALAATCHDLKTPLTTILGASKTLLRHGDSLDTEKRMEFTTSIERQSAKMLEMIQEVLTTSRLESGGVTMKREEIDLRELIETLIFDLETGQLGAGRKIVSHFDPDQPLMWGDRMATMQILTNLVENALKYGGDPIVVQAVEGASEVVLSVTDQGDGIPTDQLTTIFDRFKQMEGAEGQGFGLGLYIVGNLVEAQGGSIEVDSDPERGTAFTARFPKRSGDRTVDLTD